MKKYIQASLIGVLFAALPLSVFATAGEVAEKAASATNKGLTKTETGVKRGLQKAADGIERGGSATGRAVSKTAKKLGLPASESPSSSSPVATGDVEGKLQK